MPRPIKLSAHQNQAIVSDNKYAVESYLKINELFKLILVFIED